jgi:predicted nucleic acid-binding protein
MSKIFFDANILLDILLPSRPNHSKALEVYAGICDRYDVLATSENILTTVEYIANKNGTSCETIGRFFTALEANFELYGFADILQKSLKIYGDACKQQEKIDFEDLLQLQCAMHHGCTTFITQDKGIHKLETKIEICSLESVL